jgi:hypothetical protein
VVVESKNERVGIRAHKAYSRRSLPEHRASDSITEIIQTGISANILLRKMKEYGLTEDSQKL